MFRLLSLGVAIICVGLLANQPISGQDQKKADHSKAYEFHAAPKSSGGFLILRIKVKTGECWIANGKKWSLIADADPIRTGDYDLMQVGNPGRISLPKIMRFDRVSGTSWLLEDGSKWVKMDEPK